MARFGQGFIQALTNPSYQQGLFTAAQGPGIALGEAAEKEQKQKMLQQFMQGSPVQQGRLLQQEGVRTGNLQLAVQGKQIEESALKDGVKQGIDAIKARMLKLPEGELEAAQANLEKYVASVGGNVLDVSNVATEIKELRRQQELDNFTFEQKKKERDEQAVIDTFFSVPIENREKFLEGAANKGFGDIAAKLEQRELERQVEQSKLQSALTDRTKTVDVTGLESRIKALPQSQTKTDLLARVGDIKKRIPNFEEGKTFNPGERNTLLKELDAINNDIARFAAGQDQAELIAERGIENDIRSMRATASNFKPLKDSIVAKAKELEKEKGTDRFGFGTSYQDFLVEAEQALIQERKDQTEAIIKDMQAGISIDDKKDSKDQGTKENPYKFTAGQTKEFNNIPKGSFYIHPTTGKLMQKG